MKTSMHILIIPSWYPQFIGDVGGSFFREQAIALQKAGYSVGVIYPQIRSLKNLKDILKKPYGLTVENDEGVSTLRWYTANYFPKVKNYNKNHWVKIALKLFEIYIAKYGKPDIIHVHSMLNAGFAAKLIYETYGIPYVITEHSTAFARNLIPQETIHSLLPVIKQAKACIAVSIEFSLLLNNLFGRKKWEYIPNIVNDAFLKCDLVVDENKVFTFINVCLLDHKKRVDILIHAFSQAFYGNQNVRLKIGGDGPMMLALKKQAKDLNIEAQITFLGKLSRERVKEEVAISNAFVLSSEYETFGVVVVEALALGKPVIATKCGGPESILTPSVGYLVEKNSVEEMKITLIELYENNHKFSSFKIREYCQENFSEKAVIYKLAKIYNEYRNLNE